MQQRAFSVFTSTSCETPGETRIALEPQRGRTAARRQLRTAEDDVGHLYPSPAWPPHHRLCLHTDAAASASSSTTFRSDGQPWGVDLSLPASRLDARMYGSWRRSGTGPGIVRAASAWCARCAGFEVVGVGTGAMRVVGLDVWGAGECQFQFGDGTQECWMCYSTESTSNIAYAVDLAIFEPWADKPKITAVVWGLGVLAKEAYKSITDVLYGDGNLSGHAPHTITKPAHNCST